MNTGCSRPNIVHLRCVLIFVAHLLLGVGSTINLSTNVDDVFVNSGISFTCSSSSPVEVVKWCKTDQGSNSKETVLYQQFVNGTCAQSSNYLDCFCNSTTVYTCVLKTVTLSHDGQRWWCGAFGDSQVTSNSYTISLKIPLSSLTILPQNDVSYTIYNETSTFTCVTSLTRPQTNVYWFEDGRNITNVANSSYSADVVTSSLKYTPTAYRDGNVSCLAQYVYKTIIIILTKSTRTKVQYPVSKPVVSITDIIINSTVSIREGRVIEFRCASSGYPTPSYRWNHPRGVSDGEIVTLNFIRNDKTIVCTASSTYYSLDGTISTHTTESKTFVNINVLYPPSIKKFISKDLGQVLVDDNIRVLRGDDIGIVCESDSNPPATVFWQGQQVNSYLLTVHSILHDTAWTCIASNTMIEETRTTTTEAATRNLSATVLYGPVVPTITYNILPHSDKSWIAPTNETIRVIVGSTLMLVCSVDSMPTPVYSWGFGHEWGIRIIANATRATNTNFTCTANNTMDLTFKGIVTGRNSSTAYLNLLYGPDNIIAKYNNTIQIDQVLKVITGWSFAISCVANSDPAPNISWYGPGVQEGNVMFINDASTDMNKNITCRAVNNMVDSVGHSVSETAHKTFTLDVLYAPTDQRPQNKTVLLNTSLTVVCNLTNVGNPPASTFTWIRKDTKTVVGTKQTLTINNIGLTHEGEYQCNASNRMQPIGHTEVYGSSQSTFYINVEYGAYIRAFKANESNTTIIVDQGEAIELVCDADGDPQPTVRIVNATRGNVIILVETEAHKAKSQIHRARCEYDAGSYKCLANNRYSQGQQKQSLALLVNCSPRASPFSPPITEHYIAPNDSAVVTFTIIAYPEPRSSDFNWYKRVDDEWEDMSRDSNNFLINTSDDKMQTQLTILRVQLGDYAEYMANVSNTLGSVAQVFTLHAQSKPHVPKYLLIYRVEKTGIVITWVPGFNGGHDQNFTIRYKEVDIEIWRDIYVAGSLISYTWTIGGLKPGMTYQIKMLAENKMGKSEWTNELTETTLVDAVDKGSAAPAIGGAIGAAAGVGIIVAVIVVIWRHKTRALHKSDAKHNLTRRSINHVGGTYENIGQNAAIQYDIPDQYEDLMMERQTSNASNTDGSYSTYILDAPATRRGNKYETLEELDVREYATLYSEDTRRAINTSSNIQPEMSAQIVSADDDREYVNMKLSAL